MKKYLLLLVIPILLLTGCSQNNKIKDEIEKDSEKYYGILEKITGKEEDFSYKIKNDNNYIITEKTNDAIIIIDIKIEYMDKKYPERGSYSYIDNISLETEIMEYKEALKSFFEGTYESTEMVITEKDNKYYIKFDISEDEAYFKYLKAQYDTINNATEEEFNQMVNDGTLLIQ